MDSTDEMVGVATNGEQEMEASNLQAHESRFYSNTLNPMEIESIEAEELKSSTTEENSKNTNKKILGTPLTSLSTDLTLGGQKIADASPNTRSTAQLLWLTYNREKRSS
jgi:hypothetical protein